MLFRSGVEVFRLEQQTVEVSGAVTGFYRDERWGYPALCGESFSVGLFELSQEFPIVIA